MKESDILYETENLYMCRTSRGLEIRLNGVTHAVTVGKPKDAESGRRVMDRLERYPSRLREMYNHSGSDLSGVRTYDVVAINEKTGRRELLNSSPMPHREAVAFKSKFSARKHVRIQLQETR